MTASPPTTATTPWCTDSWKLFKKYIKLSVAKNYENYLPTFLGIITYAAAHFTLWGKHKNCLISLNGQQSNNELWCLLIFDFPNILLVYLIETTYLLFGTILDFIYPIMTTQLEGMKEKEGADTVQSRWVDSSLQLCRKLHQQISLRNHSGCFANTYWGTHPSSQLALSLLGNKIWFL